MAKGEFDDDGGILKTGVVMSMLVKKEKKIV